jgi:hypothetical protein
MKRATTGDNKHNAGGPPSSSSHLDTAWGVLSAHREELDEVTADVINHQ